MDGFMIAGKAFCVCEELKQLAEKNKGKSVADLMRERRSELIKKAVDKQFDEIIREIEYEKRNNK